MPKKQEVNDLKPGVIKLRTNPDVCQGCRSCEAVCSLVHQGFVAPSSTGMKVVEKEKLGTFELVVCQQCFDMPCVYACPTGAMARNAYSGAVEVGEGCIGCGACAAACPYDAIIMSEVSGEMMPHKCNLCGGLPECVSACPRQALSW